MKESSVLTDYIYVSPSTLDSSISIMPHASRYSRHETFVVRAVPKKAFNDRVPVFNRSNCILSFKTGCKSNRYRV